MNVTARRGNLAGPVLLIGFGTLLLMVNLGRVPMSLWGALARLWPLALVLLGLDLLIPRRSVVGSIAVAGLLLLVLFAGAGLAFPVVTRGEIQGGESVNVPSSGGAEADISLIPAAGLLRVESLESSGALLSGTVRLPGGAQVATSVEQEGDRTIVEVKAAGFSGVPINWGTEEVWNLGISQDPRLWLSVTMGAGEVRIDARGLDLDTLKATTGAGRIEVFLPEGESSVSLSGGVGELVIRVPDGASVRLDATTVLGGVNVPPGYRKIGSTYLSPGFQEQGHLEIDASLAIGGVTLTEY